MDYAHTDDAFAKSDRLSKGTCAGYRGRVITLWLRWRSRPHEASAHGPSRGEGSDLVVLTSDNPRSEEPGAIIAEALVGVKETGVECIVEEDRAAAIRIAIQSARKERYRSACRQRPCRRYRCFRAVLYFL